MILFEHCAAKEEGEPGAGGSANLWKNRATRTAGKGSETRGRRQALAARADAWLRFPDPARHAVSDPTKGAYATALK